jgi:hypothetical protein
VAVTAPTMVFLLIAVRPYARTSATLRGHVLATFGRSVRAHSSGPYLITAMPAGTVGTDVDDAYRGNDRNVEPHAGLAQDMSRDGRILARDFATVVGYFASPDKPLPVSANHQPINGVQPLAASSPASQIFPVAPPSDTTPTLGTLTRTRFSLEKPARATRFRSQ